MAAVVAVIALGATAPASAGTGPDVTVDASVRPREVDVGDPARLTVTITNIGDTDATGVVLTQALGDGVSVDVVSATQGVCDGTLQIVCDIGTLTPGQVETVVLDLVADAPGSVTNTSTVASLLDGDPTNNATTSALSVVRSRDARGCTIRGTAADDRLRGTAGRDVICGRGGDDRLIGLGGRDTLKGGSGADSLSGGPGADRLIGGPGRDRYSGGGSRDRCTVRGTEPQRSC
jgi:uncharacterized repeat protein (TIGR01451 family)